MSEITQKPPFLSQDNKQAMRNPWVLGWLAFVAFVLLVNALFIMTAMKTNPGLVDADYYEKGRNYEKTIQDKITAKNNLGWQVNLNSATADVTMSKAMTYHVNIVDKAGIPLEATSVVLHAYRASDASADFSQPMQQVSAGLYSAEMTFPLKGHWELIAKIRQGEDKLSFTKKIMVKAL